MNLPIYKHFKGSYYQIVTFDLKGYPADEVNILPDNFFCRARLESTLEECTVYKFSDGSYIVLTEDPHYHNQPLVLYNSVGSSLNYWIRTYENFYSVIDKVNKIKRFTRILS